MTVKQCPKCGHERSDLDDPEIPDTQCPACGIYYFKYLNRKSELPTQHAPQKAKKETLAKDNFAFIKNASNYLRSKIKRLFNKIKLSHAFFIAFVAVVIMQINQDPDPQAIRAALEYQKQQEAACITDLRCTGEKYDSAIFSPCSRLIEQHAKYQFRWDGIRFSRLDWANPEKTKLIYFGDAVQFQNGFSAWQNMVYSCTYDIAANSITHVAVTPGRLPR
jgi:predicted  nucleic acid-binding Zn-ribbon protein